LPSSHWISAEGWSEGHGRWTGEKEKGEDGKLEKTPATLWPGGTAEARAGEEERREEGVWRQSGKKKTKFEVVDCPQGERLR
jgi:hypothetical protein